MAFLEFLAPSEQAAVREGLVHTGAWRILRDQSRVRRVCRLPRLPNENACEAVYDDCRFVVLSYE